MIDHLARITTVVKQELTDLALANGIDKSFVGFAVAPPVPTMIQTPEGPALVPSWTLVITLRVELLGKPPVTVPITIPGPLPDDSDFRGAVRQALEMASNERDKQIKGGATA